MNDSEFKLGCVLAAIFVAFAASIVWFQATNESATYNRLTGAHTTAWDALWVELRVQDTTKDQR